MTNDLITRAAAAAILVLAFAGAMVVVVHGYWLNPAYVIPPVLAGILGSTVLGAAGVLGFRVGANMTMAAQSGTAPTKSGGA